MFYIKREYGCNVEMRELVEMVEQRFFVAGVGHGSATSCLWLFVPMYNSFLLLAEKGGG